VKEIYNHPHHPVRRANVLADWRIVAPLGQGGTAIVSRVQHRWTGVARVVKHARTPDASNLLQAEVRALRVLRHPAVPRLDACGVDAEGRAWLVREALEGDTLDVFLAAHRGDPALVRALLDQGLDLLVHLAAVGYVHGDLKPANLAVEVGEGGPRLRVLDLGGDGDVLTPAFATPERLSCTQAPEPSDDLFALAASFWLGLYGEHPYPGYPLLNDGAREVRAAARDPFSAFLAPLLALDRSRRVATLEAALRHREATWPDAVALPLEGSLAWRARYAPDVGLHAEVRADLASWLGEPGAGFGVATLAAGRGLGASRLVGELALDLGLTGADVRVVGLESPGSVAGLRELLAEPATGPGERPRVTVIDHVYAAPARLLAELRDHLERRRAEGAAASGRFLLVYRGAQPLDADRRFELTAVPVADLGRLLERVLAGCTVRPSGVERWARAVDGSPATLLTALAILFDRGGLVRARGTVELGAPPADASPLSSAPSWRERVLAVEGPGARPDLLARVPDRPELELVRGILAGDDAATRLGRLLRDAEQRDDDVLFAWSVAPWAAVLTRLGLPAVLVEAVARRLEGAAEDDAAATLYRSLLPSSEAREASLGLARLAFRAGRWDELEAWRTARGADLSPDEVRLACEAALLRGRYDEARELLGGVSADVLATDAGWAWLQAISAFYRSDYATAREAALRCVALESPDVRPEALNLAGIVAERQGAFDEAATFYERALAAARARWDRRTLWKVAMNLGVLLQRRQQPYLALERYREALALAEATGNREGRMKVALNLGNLLLSLGHEDEGAVLAEQARDLAVQLNDPFTEHYAEVQLGEAARWRGDLDASRAWLESASRAFAELGNARERLQTEAELALTLLVAGQPVAAADRLERSLHHPDAASVPDVRQGLARHLVLVAGYDPSTPRRRARLSRLAALLDDDPSVEGHLLAWRLAVEEGRPADALRAACRAGAALDDRLKPLVPADRLRLLAREPWPWQNAELAFVASLHGSLHESTRTRFRSLLEVTGRMNTAEQPEALLDLLLDEAISFTGAERGFILLADDGDPERLKVVAARNIDQEQIRKKEHKVSYGIARDVLSSGKAVATVDAMSDDRYREYLSIHKLRLRSVLCHPLSIEGQPQGVLYLDNRFAQSLFGDDELYAVRILADHVGLALTRKRLLTDLAAHEADLCRSRDEIARLNDQLRQELDQTSRRLAERERDLERFTVQGSFPGIVGSSAPLRRCLFMVERVKDADVPVLVQGESGTGKELIARAIHFQGTRKAGPFVAVNCGAIPQNLFESELFGHKKGSFTGATADKPGLFEAAHGGTLFLDEIADLPPDMQVKLLRVLQSGEVRRIGDPTTRIVNVRVVAALNRDLKELVASGRFREDLYYRLNVVAIVLPPLRERRDDIPLLVHHFLKRQHDEGFSAVTGISREALRLLVEHAWPGNVRQLETALKNAALFAADAVLRPEDFSELASFQEPAPDLARLARTGLDRGMSLKDFEDLLIRHTLELTGGNKKRTAEILGIDRRTLYNRLAGMGS